MFYCNGIVKNITVQNTRHTNIWEEQTPHPQPPPQKKTTKKNTHKKQKKNKNKKKNKKKQKTNKQTNNNNNNKRTKKKKKKKKRKKETIQNEKSNNKQPRTTKHITIVLTHDKSGHKISHREESHCKYQHQVYLVTRCPRYAEGRDEIKYTGNA